MPQNEREHGHALSAAGVLITLGIIYGDIGTSPIYVLNAIVSSHTISRDLVFGGLSCIFWTLVMVTTVKYVFLALSADNRGEGGIFALYALVRRYKVKWTIIPAIIGCASLIADGFITPPISISSAIEGLRILSPQIPTVPIVLAILVGLFVFQQFGTRIVGGIFGPIMMIWFTMIGVLGIKEIIKYHNETGVIDFYFQDSLMNGSIKVFKEFCDQLILLKSQNPQYRDINYSGLFIVRPKAQHPEDLFRAIAESGNDHICIGVETGSDRLRHEMDKRFTNII